MNKLFSRIMNHQAPLMAQFRTIERANGFDLPPIPVDIHTRKGQHELRRLAWHIQEELCEAAEAMESDLETGSRPAHKELIDALHFIAEFMLTLGYWPDELVLQEARPSQIRGPAANLFQTMLDLGLMVNTLKNRPWKQTERICDEWEFKRRLSKFVRSFFRTCREFGMSEQMIESVYYGKALENTHRIVDGV